MTLRADQAILDQTNELARELYAILGYTVPKGYRFDRATHPQAHQAWRMACTAQELLTETDLENVLAELGEDTP